MQPTKVLFVPFGITSGLLAGMVARRLFGLAWRRISADEPPEPEERGASVPMLTASLALEGAISRVSRGLVERGARAGFLRLTGSWPGEEEPEGPQQAS